MVKCIAKIVAWKHSSTGKLRGKIEIRTRHVIQVMRILIARDMSAVGGGGLKHVVARLPIVP
jgi:hypothetical protein